MPQTASGAPRRSARRPVRSEHPSPGGKVAITVRLGRNQARQLRALAAAENRTVTNFVETILIRDLALRQEAERVIAVRAAPGTSTHIAPAEILRAEGETDAAYARRQTLLTELWEIADDD